MEVKTQNLILQLQTLNQKKSEKVLTHKEYTQRLVLLFNLPHLEITEKYKSFCGGFILGEGSINSSLKKKEKMLLFVDLEFSVTQNLCGISHLIRLLSIFHTGRIYFKTGSQNTFVFKISNRQSIFEKIIPFWKKYIYPYQAPHERFRFENFSKFEKLFKKQSHKTKQGIITELLPLWDLLRKQKGQKKETFKTLKEAVLFIEKV